ncbi:hypothetical protein AURDEDRAFT_155555 [Auricularia subglabra TFB-10046 SS5]|nr:hypothetical protein AURDEDRAFT_155555 [Auricularia subglabra TFB-10046 SS5]
MLRTTITQTARTAVRTVETSGATRSFATTSVMQKTVTEKVAETADKVNKGVGSGLADAIEVGETATEKVKETLGVGAEKTKQAANTASSAAQGVGKDVKAKTEQTAETAKQRANELNAKGKAKADEHGST